MANIPRSSIKRFVRKHFKANITDDAAAEIVNILEEKAKSMARYAVESAKKDGREKVTRKDIMKYVIKGYDD